MKQFFEGFYELFSMFLDIRLWGFICAVVVIFIIIVGIIFLLSLLMDYK